MKEKTRENILVISALICLAIATVFGILTIKLTFFT